jgi:hypothetical protein
MIRLLALLLLCGCSVPTVHQSIPANPFFEAADFRTVSYVNIFTNRGFAWDNDNPIGDQPYLVTDVWATTNLMIPFAHKFYVGPMTNAFALVPDRQQEFYIIRFLQTNTGQFSDWARHTN